MSGPFERRLAVVTLSMLAIALLSGCTFVDSVGEWVTDPSSTGPPVPGTAGGSREESRGTSVVASAEPANPDAPPEEVVTPIDVETESDPVAASPDADEQAVGLEPPDDRPRFEAPDGTLLPVLGSTELDSGLVVQGLRAGADDAPECGPDSTVIVHYHGTLEDGTVVDTTRDREPAGPWPIAQLMPGWRQGMAGMRVGGVRRLVIPAALAYGDEAITDPESGDTLIPAGSTLVYTIELIELR